jgi:hypothetical protein
MSIERFDGFEERLGQMTDATATGYEAAVRTHMPDCLYRDFCLWEVSRQNHNRQAAMQLMGALQQSKLMVRLLDGLTEGETSWQRLLRASMATNGWQMLEVVSDNLAIGLAQSRADDGGSDATRRALLRTFNTLMAERLRGRISAASARDRLSSSRSEGISLFNQHISPLKHRSLAETFIDARGGALSEIEYAALPHLIANIEAGVDLVDAVEIEHLRPLVRDSMIARYEGVNKLLDPDELSLEEVLDVSAHTILVIPTLAYCISALIRCTGGESRLERLIDEGTVTNALYDAALLVRLQNDVGTGLLTSDNSTRQMFLHELEERSRERKGENLIELLVRTGKDYELLNRIWKDACLSEFNVCLNGIRHDQVSREVLSVFSQGLAVCVKAYSVHKDKLASALRKINDGLEDSNASQIILRFVRFHEQLYDGHYHDTVGGDYAVY